jgi:hypothetical protein
VQPKALYGESMVAFHITCCEWVFSNNWIKINRQNLECAEAS